MTVRSFLDTNVLVYADDTRDPLKQDRAVELIEQLGRTRSGVVSTQVLQEYYVTAVQKLKSEPAHAQRKVEILGRLDVIKLDLTLIIRAIEFHRLQQTSFWDGLIVAAAQSGGCAILFTEDLQHGRRLAGVQVINPFL